MLVGHELGDVVEPGDRRLCHVLTLFELFVLLANETLHRTPRGACFRLEPPIVFHTLGERVHGRFFQCRIRPALTKTRSGCLRLPGLQRRASVLELAPLLQQARHLVRGRLFELIVLVAGHEPYFRLRARLVQQASQVEW